MIWEGLLLAVALAVIGGVLKLAHERAWAMPLLVAAGVAVVIWIAKVNHG